MSNLVISEQLSAEKVSSRADLEPVRSNCNFDSSEHNANGSGRSLGLAVAMQPSVLTHPPSTASVDPVVKDQNTKHRCGLPEGFVSRTARFGRTVLFEDNVYRLPNGLEFIPQPPSGTLGQRNHQYALLTLEQYEKRKRGSVYLRTDGRVFDYACDHGFSDRELFDTGFTIDDLERTGRYAPKLKLRVSSLRKGGKKREARRKIRT